MKRLAAMMITQEVKSSKTLEEKRFLSLSCRFSEPKAEGFLALERQTLVLIYKASVEPELPEE
jgi:hypothetical protein